MFKNITIAIVLLYISACTMNGLQSSYPTDPEITRKSRQGKLFSKDGEDLTIYDANKKQPIYDMSLKNPTNDPRNAKLIAEIARDVQSKKNPILWKASIDILRDKPMSLIDESYGFISTDWYNISGGKMMRMSVFMNGQELNENSILVSVFVRDGNVGNGSKDESLAQMLHSAIIKRATTLASTLR